MTILLFTLLPISALATAPGGQVIYVGNENVTSGGYWTTDSDGNVTAYTAGGTPTDNYIRYDAENNVLTLHDATIKKGLDYNTSIEGGTLINGSAIGVFNQSGNAELTISLVGTNTIANVSKGIFVLASSASTGSSNLTIQGDGSLNASASQTGILVQSNSNNAALCVENAEVTASVDGAFKNGVLVQAKDGSDVSLTVNGGSLTASVNANISFRFGTGVSGSGTPTVTVSNNAIVRANGGIANNSSTSIQYGTGNEENGGIVFDGSAGTVYGSVTLQDDLTISEDETLTVPDGSKLDCNNNLTNNGTILASGGNLEGEPTSGTGTVVSAPKITTESLASGTVGAAYSQTLQADNTPTQWSITSGSLPDGLNLSGSTISGTPTTAGTSTFTVKAENSAGSDSKEYTLTVSEPTTYTITAEASPADAGSVTVNGSGTSANVKEDTEVILTATANEGYRFGAWMENDKQVSAEATYTFKATGDRTLTAKFEKKVIGVTLDKTTLELFTGGRATLTATVEPSDATNQNVTWQSNNANVATVENGVVTAMSAGETTITVQTQDGNHTATCQVTVTQSTYGISANPSTLDFGSVYTGYTRPDAKTVTITNTGNRPQTLTLPASTSSFEVSALSTTTLPADETATFTVRPKADLPVGTYSENITVSGTGSATAAITVRFTVTEPYVPEPEPEPTYFTLDFDDHPCEGVTLNSNLTGVEEGGTLYLYVEKEDETLYDYDNMRIYAKRGVNADWEELTEDPKRPGVYPIERIWTDIFIKVEGVTPKDPTAIERVETLRIYATGDLLHVETPTRQRVTIVSLAGALIADGEQEGARIYRDLNAGVYIVRVGDYATKVRVE